VLDEITSTYAFSVCSEVKLTQLCKRFVRDMRQFDSFVSVLQFPQQIKLTAMIHNVAKTWFKMESNTKEQILIYSYLHFYFI
jgi:hypothetical protein